MECNHLNNSVRSGLIEKNELFPFYSCPIDNNLDGSVYFFCSTAKPKVKCSQY